MDKRTGVIIATVLCLLFFGGGMVAGYFLFNKSGDSGDVTNEASAVTSMSPQLCNTTFSAERERYRQSYIDKSQKASCFTGTCNSDDLPRNYIAYHLNGENIRIDGKLDDSAWNEVPWTEYFMGYHKRLHTHTSDTRGPEYPEPYFNTRVKMRWDDDRLYVGRGYNRQISGGPSLEMSNKYGEKTVLSYKQIIINVKNLTWDLAMIKPYMDGGTFEGWWTSKVEKATYTDGIINDPNGKGTFWSLEIAIPFDTLDDKNNRDQPTPVVDEAWFVVFSRPQYKFKIVGGKYVKDEAFDPNWWTWQPYYICPTGLFGLVQFKKDLSDRVFDYDRWHIFRALFAVFEAEHAYKAVNGMYITKLTDLSLHIAPKELSSDCVDISVTVTDADFEVVVRSKLDSRLPVGHMRGDRKIWFT